MIMDLQEVFDKVAAHLLTQNAKSLRSTPSYTAANEGVYGGGWYRGENGTKCAIGCLIADEHYAPELEGRISSNDDVRLALEKSGIDVNTLQMRQLLRQLQRIHDNFTPLRWSEELENAALDFGLVLNSRPRPDQETP